MVSSNDCIKKYGNPADDAATPNVNEQTEFERKWMTLYVVHESYATKIPALPKRIYCNKDMVGPLKKALQNIVDRGLEKEVKTWDGCFNIRNKRGLSSLSLHSWAIAIDINATWNGLGKTPTMSAGLVKCFTDAGFEWGGTWTRLDGMHFQLASI
jgi:hypothetical protein